MPNLVDLCIHVCILCPAVNRPMGDKCLQIGPAISVCRHTRLCRGQTGAGDVSGDGPLSCFLVQAVVYPLTCVRGHVEEIGQQRAISGL